MSTFTTSLIVEPNSDMTQWTLRAPFDFWTGSGEGDGDKITVPAGFATDFASIPAAFWSVLPPTGTYGKAAVVHDFLYQNLGEFNSCGTPKKYTRLQCDGVFRDAMSALGVGYHTVNIMYHLVRAFGAGHFGMKPQSRGLN